MLRTIAQSQCSVRLRPVELVRAGAESCECMLKGLSRQQAEGEVHVAVHRALFMTLYLTLPRALFMTLYLTLHQALFMVWNLTRRLILHCDLPGCLV